MKQFKLFVIIGLLIFSQNLFSQKQIAPDHYAVYLKDKAGTPYSVDKPEAFLSKKAVERRKRYGIEINQQDLPVSPKYVQKLKETGVEIVNVSKWLNCVIIKTGDEEKLAQIENLSFVKTEFGTKLEKPKHKEKVHKPVNIPNDKEKLKKVYKYGKGSNQIKMLNGDYLHKKGFSGEGMTIAVLDHGFSHVHELPAFKSIRDNNQILGTRDFVDGDTSVWFHGAHGMYVLSIMASNMKGKLVGTAPKANYWLIRTENNHSEYMIEEYSWVCGAEFADSVGVDIIHSSLSYTKFDDGQKYKYEDLDGNTAVCTIGSDIAASKGILINTSAGNEGASSWHYISAPADADSCLAIGACWRRGKPTRFSSNGPTFDNRIKPNVTAKGVFTAFQHYKGKIRKSSGTSISGPVVAGLVACLWQAFPEKNNMEIIHAIEQSADRYDNPDGKTGYGIPDFNKAYQILKGNQTANN